MSVRCEQICSFLETLAPLEYVIDDDPVGLQLGDPQQIIKKVYVALELNDSTLEEALIFGADMVILHHSPFYRPFADLREDKRQNKRIVELIRFNVALYSAHTNWDCAEGGVNHVLAGILGLEKTEVLSPTNQNNPSVGLGCIGYLARPQTLLSFAQHTASCLRTESLRFCGEPDTLVSKVACCGGSGISLLREAYKKGAQVLVTGDIKHHDALYALDLGMCLIDGGHYATERPAMSVMCAQLQQKFSNVEFMEQNCSTDPFKIIPFY